MKMKHEARYELIDRPLDANMKFAKQNTIVFFYLVIVVQSDGLEILQFSQIPQFQGAILGTYAQLHINTNKPSQIYCVYWQ